MQYVFSLQAPKTVESLEWKTDIVESEDGREQSNKVRDVPRQSFSVTAFCDNANYQETFNLLYSGMSAQWAVPTWTEAQVIPFAEGFGQVACDPANRDFRVGYYAILWSNPKSYQLLEIATIGADYISFVESVEMRTNCVLMPVRIARIVGQPSRQYNGFDQFINVNFEVEDANALTTTAPAQFLGYDLNFPETEGLKDGDRAESAFEVRNDLLDFGLGRTSSYYPWRHSRVTYPYAVILDGQAEKQTFREWLHRRSGKYSKFWMPTWENDLRVANWSGTQFNIYDDGISETDSIRQTIAIQTETGWHARTVQFAQTPVNGILNGVLSASFTGTIQRVCWLGLRRLESDRVEIAHTTGGVAKVALNLVEVEPNGDDEGNLLTETGLDISTELGQPIALESASEISQLLNGSKKISEMVTIAPATAEATGAYMVTATPDSTNNKMLVSEIDDWIIGKHVAEADPHPQYLLKTEAGGRPNLHAGIVGDYPVITNGAAGVVTCGACRVALYDNANNQGVITEYDVLQATLTLTANGSQLIVIDYNAGTPIYKLVDSWDLTAYDLSKNVVIERKYYFNSDIHTTDFAYRSNDLPADLAMRIGQTEPYARVGGQGLEPSAYDAYKIAVTAAYVWAGPKRILVDAFASGTDLISLMYKTAGGVYTYQKQDGIYLSQYNPDGQGIQPLTNDNWFSVNWLYRTIGDTKEVYAVMDNQQYATADKARVESKMRTGLPFVITEHSVLIGRVIYSVSTGIYEVQSAWTAVFNQGTVSDHNALSNLQGGDTTYRGHITSAEQTKLTNSIAPVEGSGESYLPYISVRAVATANVGTLVGVQTVDGIALAQNDFVLLSLQTTTTQNGVYRVNGPAEAWTRATGYDTDAEIRRRIIICTGDGTTNKNGYRYICTNTSAITVGSTALTYALVPRGLGTGALNAATGNHTHTSIATTASSSIGASLGLRYNSRTTSAGTAATDVWVVFSGSTAARIETMPDGVAVSNNSGRWVRYTNKATVPWTLRQATSNTLNGSASDFTLPVGYSVDVFNTADNTWITTYYGKTTALLGDDLTTTLADNAESSTLPTTASGTVTSKIQQVRDYLKYLLTQITAKRNVISQQYTTWYTTEGALYYRRVALFVANSVAYAGGEIHVRVNSRFGATDIYLQVETDVSYAMSVTSSIARHRKNLRDVKWQIVNNELIIWARSMQGDDKFAVQILSGPPWGILAASVFEQTADPGGSIIPNMWDDQATRAQYADLAASGADSDLIASTAWVRDRFADTIATYADTSIHSQDSDKVDGKHVVVCSYGDKGSATDTLYFTFQ